MLPDWRGFGGGQGGLEGSVDMQRRLDGGSKVG